MPKHSTIEVGRIKGLPEAVDVLLKDADAEGFDTMSVLRDEWSAGSNRFERPGEVLMLAKVDGTVAGIGGITQDFVEADHLRMRRFYVRPAFRRLGVGSQIALHVLEHARPFNRPIVLHADGPDAEVFWPTLGFVSIDRIHTTHVFRPFG
ncbi:GNAT family N-acetyltransferase [Fulvimarina sp. MAC8]|uniref:GNAT family N-acetyltransferase n=1 Tax=Fulvimarina sp. MAC8 TaxID=3162874 RepID=UPI0032EF4CB1